MNRNLLYVGAGLLLVLALTADTPFDAATERGLLELNPAVRGRFRAFFRAARAAGWQVLVIDAHRTAAEQNAAHAVDPRNPPAGRSSHELRRAVDVNFLRPGAALRKATSRAAWLASNLPALAARAGLQWGGNFSHYHDPVHFYV